MTTSNKFWSSPVLKRGLLISLIPIVFGAFGGVSASKFREGQRESEMANIKEDIKGLQEDKANSTDIEYIKQAIDDLKQDQRDIKADQKDIKNLLIQHIDK